MALTFTRLPKIFSGRAKYLYIMNAQFLSPSQLHERWGFHPESLRRMIREGRLPAIRIGKRLRIPLAEIEAYETANRIISQRSTTY